MNYFWALFYLFISPTIFAQTFSDYISDHAIELDSTLSLDSADYIHFKDIELMMLGEMHGTQEPAKLIQSIASLILKRDETISIGLEIPKAEMESYLIDPCDSSLRNSIFFSKENVDGRNGKAWYDLITFCRANKQIHLFFFDNFESMNIKNRDSAMYLSIIEQRTLFSKDKIITLSGNIHNRLVPFRTNPTMGSFCFEDTTNFNSNAICSIHHVYSEGKMLNNIGNGLELRTIEFQESVYSSSSNFKNYLLLYETEEPSENNCIFYTRKVNYSEELE